jgi:hypothetical protein
MIDRHHLEVTFWIKVPVAVAVFLVAAGAIPQLTKSAKPVIDYLGMRRGAEPGPAPHGCAVAAMTTRPWRALGRGRSSDREEGPAM